MQYTGVKGSFDGGGNAGLGFGVWGLGFVVCVCGFVFWGLFFGFWGFGVWGLEGRVENLGFRVQGSRVEGLGCRAPLIRRAVSRVIQSARRGFCSCRPEKSQ